jgi:hypothetical protein
MKKFLPSSIHEVVKGLIMVVIAMVILRFVPVRFKAMILGAPAVAA